MSSSTNESLNTVGDNSVAMQFIKAVGDNKRLRCHCGREFWHSSIRSKCPDCGKSWNGLYFKYILIKVQPTLGDDFVTVMAFQAVNGPSILHDAISRGSHFFGLCSGILMFETGPYESSKFTEEILTMNVNLVTERLRNFYGQS